MGCHRGRKQGSAFLLQLKLTFLICIQGGVLHSFYSCDDSCYGRDITSIMCIAGYTEETCIKLL